VIRTGLESRDCHEDTKITEEIRNDLGWNNAALRFLRDLRAFVAFL